MPQRPLRRYKIARGESRTRREACQLLGMPLTTRLPGFICRLPLRALEQMKHTVAQRMENQAHPVLGQPTEFEETPEAAPEPYEPALS